MNSFTHLLAYHCAPTLMGIKTANLISYDRRDDIERLDEAKQMMHHLRTKDVGIIKLCECDQKILTLVYRRQMLVNHLNTPQIKAFLKRMGYPVHQGFYHILMKLKERVKSEKGFPHEIGIFLGYPLEDVEGFIENQGKSCKMCGYWKVYGDEKKARLIFDQYNACREQLMNLMLNNIPIEHWEAVS